MALSGSYNFTSTRDSIISRAYRLVGVIGEGESANSTQITNAAEALNHIVKQYEADGMPVWAMTQASFTPVASTASYTIGVGSTISSVAPLKILRVWTRNTTSNIDRPLTLITRDEYETLGTKAVSTGSPNLFMYIPPGGNVGEIQGTLYLYPMPDATFVASNAIYIVGQRPFADFDDATDNPDFPSYWHNALVWAVAEALAYEYGVGLSERAMLSKQAQSHKEQALSFGTEEGSFCIQPRYY